jgi:DNA-binding MarR family transcriptional regulator
MVTSQFPVGLARGGLRSEAGPDYELIELLFFAYRDFVGEADRLLARHGFGRAHHRVLHFVNRNQGLTVADLLQILEITKQSLARVLRDLVDGGFVEQQAGQEDRRQRLLFLTDRGKALAGELAAMQGRRIARALAASDPEGRDQIVHFLEGLIDRDRQAILGETVASEAAE